MVNQEKRFALDAYKVLTLLCNVCALCILILNNDRKKMYILNNNCMTVYVCPFCKIYIFVLCSVLSDIFLQVGEFAGASLQISDNTLVNLFPGTRSSCIAPCTECLITQMEFSYIPGDILIGGMIYNLLDTLLLLMFRLKLYDCIKTECYNSLRTN